MSKHKKHGKNTTRLFFNVFSPPDHDPNVQFPPKNQIPALAHLLSFAVPHCTLYDTSGGDCWLVSFLFCWQGQACMMSFGGCLCGDRTSPVVCGSGILLLVFFHRRSLFMACWVCVGFDIWCVLCLVLFLFICSCVTLVVCSFVILLPLFLYLTCFHVTGHIVSIFWFMHWYNGALLCGVL